MGIPTQEWEQIDATLQALSDRIVEFTDEIQDLADSDVESIPVGIFTDPVISVGNQKPSLGTQPTYSTAVANSAALAGLGAPTIATTSIDQLSVPSAPTAPALDFGTAPVTNLPSVPPTPTLQTTTIPIKPDLAIPSVPELANINIPELTTPSLPTFDQTFRLYRMK